MPQEKRPLGLKKPPKLSINRVRQIADSLENIGYATTRASKNMNPKDTSSLGKKVKNYLQESGMRDLRNAERYRKLADKASKKK